MKFVNAGKSGNREVAALVLLVWLATFVKLFWGEPPEAVRSELFAELTWPMLGLVGAAFGMTAFLMKRDTPKRRRSSDTVDHHPV